MLCRGKKKLFTKCMEIQESYWCSHRTNLRFVSRLFLAKCKYLCIITYTIPQLDYHLTLLSLVFRCTPSLNSIFEMFVVLQKGPALVLSALFRTVVLPIIFHLWTLILIYCPIVSNMVFKASIVCWCKTDQIVLAELSTETFNLVLRK